MSDPYRPSNYAPTYTPSSYVPHDPTYASGALTTRPTSSDRYEDGRPYYPSQSNLELSQNTYHRRTSDTYLSPTDDYPSHRHSSHKSKSARSHSRHRSDDKDGKGSGGRSRSHSRGKEWGATAVGGAAGAFLGNEIGHGPLGIGAGLIAGAIGAHELERRHEKHQEKKRSERGGGGDGDRKHHRRRSSGGLLSEVKGKVEGFLNPEGGEKEKRRSRSSVGGSSGGGGRRRGGYDSFSDSEEERYVGRSGGGGGRRRDDY